MTKLFILFLMGLLVSPVVYAETIEGRITNVDQNNRSLTVNPNQEGLPDKIQLYVSEDSKFKGGIKSLNELKAGDQISVDADPTAQGYELKSIEKAKIEPAQTNGKLEKTGEADDQLAAGKIPGTYDWKAKIKRGAVNIVTSPVEIARSIHMGTEQYNLAYGWTAGLLRGVGQGALRLGAGVVDLVTFPFDFPVDHKAPLVHPEYVWEKPGVDYSD